MTSFTTFIFGRRYRIFIDEDGRATAMLASECGQ